MSSSLDEKTQFKIDWRKILILYNFRIHCDSIYFVFNDPDPVPQNCFELSNYISSLELPEHLVTNSFQSGKCCLAFNLYMLFIHKTSNFHKGLDFLSFPSSWVCVCVCVCALSHAQLFATLWTVAHQAPLSIGFTRQEYWSGLPSPPAEDLPNPGIEPASPLASALQADSLPLSYWGSPP